MVQLSHSKHVKLVNDYAATAASASLLYVNDKDPGIERKKRGKNFLYIFDQKKIAGKEEIERIKKLAIPPAWIRFGYVLNTMGISRQQDSTFASESNTDIIHYGTC